MELYEQILVNYFVENMRLGELVDHNAVVHDRRYRALCRIKEILEDDTLEDSECFYKIEGIVCVLEALGTDAGVRRDFG